MLPVVGLPASSFCKTLTKNDDLHPGKNISSVEDDSPVVNFHTI